MPKGFGGALISVGSALTFISIYVVTLALSFCRNTATDENPKAFGKIAFFQCYIKIPCHYQIFGKVETFAVLCRPTCVLDGCYILKNLNRAENFSALYACRTKHRRIQAVAEIAS